MLLGLPLLAAVALASQSPDPQPPGNPADRPPPPKAAIETRAARPPVIDGGADAEVWREAAPITAFQDWRRSEGGPPKQPTQADTAYDLDNIDIFGSAYNQPPCS